MQQCDAPVFMIAANAGTMSVEAEYRALPLLVLTGPGGMQQGLDQESTDPMDAR